MGIVLKIKTLVDVLVILFDDIPNFCINKYYINL